MHHRIPQRYRNHVEFQDFDFDDPQSLRGIKGSRSDINRHQDVTNEWEMFHQRNPNASRAEIEAFADEIDQRYAEHWFEAAD